MNEGGMETAHLSIKPRPTDDMQIWTGWGLSPEMCPDGRGSPTSQALLNLLMGGCFKAVQMCWLKRQTLSFNTPGFRTPIVVILKTNSSCGYKMGRGRLGAGQERQRHFSHLGRLLQQGCQLHEPHVEGMQSLSDNFTF